jgi:hypothetical protein
MKKLFLIAVALAGCKQGLGDRCQINDDCASPYVCNQAKMECQNTTTGGIDATVPDARFTTIDAGADASMADAATDAPVDSTVVIVDAPTD